MVNRKLLLMVCGFAVVALRARSVPDKRGQFWHRGVVSACSEKLLSEIEVERERRM